MYMNRSHSTLDELLERRALAIAILLQARIIPFGGGPQSLTGAFPRVGQRHDIKAAQREATLHAVTAVENGPRFPTVV